MNESPGAEPGSDIFSDINPNSLCILKGKAEPSLSAPLEGERFQFQRKGYYVVDKNSKADNIVFNKTVGLRDSWKK